MIKIYFFDYGCGSLNIENELMLSEDVDNFLVHQLPELSLEATDSLNDMEDNVIYWFSAQNESVLCDMIIDILKSRISDKSKMKYTVKITSDLS